MFKTRYRSHHDANRRLKEAFGTGERPEDYLKKKLNTEDDKSKTLYIHVPYCMKVCSFCPFSKYSHVPKASYDKYVINHIDRIKDFACIQTKPFDSIYFGGGTPTALRPQQMDRILDHIHKVIPLDKKAEISVETSATEMDEDMLKALSGQGVNRLSVGIQTFDDKGRKQMNRRGSGDFAASRLEQMRHVIPNTNMDLIYNYPGQTMEKLEADLRRIIDLDLAGLSFYALMIHDDTPLAKSIRDEDLRLMEDLSREKAFFDRILNRLGDYGYEMFELTKLIKERRDEYKYIQVKHDGGYCIPIGVKAGGRIGRYSLFNHESDKIISSEVPISARGRMVSEDYLRVEKVVNALQYGRISFDLLDELGPIRDDKNFRHLIRKYEEAGYLRTGSFDYQFTGDGFFFGNNIIDDMADVMIQFKTM